MSFLEEMWSRNLGNLMMSPLTPIEFLLSLMIMSLIRLAIGVVPMAVMASLFFDFNLFGLGLALVAFFCNLIFTSWSVGIIVSGLVVRNGMGAESLAWTLMFILLPLACVYYPVSVLPVWLQWVAWLLPPTYVFEGMRALMIDKVFRSDLMIAGAGDQRRAVRRRDRRLRRAAEQRAQRRQADPVRRIAAGAPVSFDCGRIGRGNRWLTSLHEREAH